MRIAHHLAKSDLLFSKINFNMYQVFDHYLVSHCVYELTIHDWKGRDPLSFIMLKGVVSSLRRRERDVTHYEDHVAERHATLSQTLFDAWKGCDPTCRREKQDGKHLWYIRCYCEQKLSFR